MSVPHEYRVAPDCWSQRQRTDTEFAVRRGAKYGISFELPVSPLPDPHATPPWVGYVTMEDKVNLLQAGHGNPILGTNLVYEFGMVVPPNTKFNFMSDANNFNGPNPASFRPLIKNGPWSSMSDANRWWSKQNWTLKDAFLEKLDVSLAPSEWFDVNGTPADSSPAITALFNAAKAKPSYIGMTFGGGWFAGHGVNTSGGQATFSLYRMHTY